MELELEAIHAIGHGHKLAPFSWNARAAGYYQQASHAGRRLVFPPEQSYAKSVNGAPFSDWPKPARLVIPADLCIEGDSSLVVAKNAIRRGGSGCAPYARAVSTSNPARSNHSCTVAASNRRWISRSEAAFAILYETRSEAGAESVESQLHVAADRSIR